MRTDIEIVRVPLDGRDVKQATRNACQLQAARDPDPRRLISTAVLEADSGFELLLVFELFNQK